MPYTKIYPVAVTALTGTGTTPQAPAVAGPAATFVFRPGAANTNGVYNTWSGLMQAVGQVPGQKFITYDDSIAQCEVPSGGWNVDNCVISTVPKVGGSGTLLIDSGAVFVFNRLDFVSARVFVHATAPVATFTGGSTAALRLDATTIDCLSTGPFIRDASAGATLVVLMENTSHIGDGVHSVLQADAGVEIDIIAVTGSSIAGNATSGAGTVGVSLDMSASIDAGPQAATFNLFPFGDSHNVPYTPTTPANWNNNSPRTLQVALDRLAAKVGPVT